MAELQWLAAEAGYGPPIGRWLDMEHWTHPVQQRVRSRTHLFQLAFAREAVARIGDSSGGCILCPQRDGLQVLGRDEAMLGAQVERVAELYDRLVAIDPPSVRLCPGDPVCEPVVTVLVRVPRPLVRVVTRDLLERNARGLRTEPDLAHMVVRAQARQADLLGYHDQIERLTGSVSEVCMRLSHYEPVE